ncbi:hypothetical protein CE91St14_22460 [Porphyromonas somerae]|nr:hypothetical protein CE91St14_22460 [Porphyromonas somerae]
MAQSSVEASEGASEAVVASVADLEEEARAVVALLPAFRVYPVTVSLIGQVGSPSLGLNKESTRLGAFFV